jgi:hypothetical protein
MTISNLTWRNAIDLYFESVKDGRKCKTYQQANGLYGVRFITNDDYQYYLDCRWQAFAAKVQRQRA